MPRQHPAAKRVRLAKEAVNKAGAVESEVAQSRAAE
jgi:hypothetical protein